jgi:hypothetical protein
MVGDQRRRRIGHTSRARSQVAAGNGQQHRSPTTQRTTAALARQQTFSTTAVDGSPEKSQVDATSYDMVCEPVLGREALENGAAGRYLDCRDAAAVEHDESVAVSGPNRSGVLGKLCDDVLDDVFRVGRVGLVIGEVHLTPASEPDTQYDVRH